MVLPDNPLPAKSAGAFPFTTRAWMVVGMICLAPLLIWLALDGYNRGGDRDYTVTFILFALLSIALMAVLLLRDEPTTALPLLIMGLILLLAVYLRIVCLNRATHDYDAFLKPWMDKFRTQGGFAALSDGSFSDYNVPYLYILALLSYIPLDDLTLIKFVSIIADFVMAFVAISLVKELGHGEKKHLFVLAGILFAPTVWLNSAYWAQCDALYAVFAVLSLLYILRSRPWLSVAMAGLAFAFKLQTMFFLPMLLVFLMTRRIKWKHLLAFPGVYLALCLPALALGRPFSSLFTIYTNQAAQYSGYLNLKAPSAYALLGFHDLNNVLDIPTAPLSIAGILAAVLVLVFVFHWLSKYRATVDGRALLSLTLFFCIAVPWCLPSMHERYFFLADIFAIIYAIVNPKRFYIAPMVVFASLNGYLAYLFGLYPMGEFKFLPGALLMAACAGLLIRDLRTQLRNTPLPALAPAPEPSLTPAVSPMPPVDLQ